MYGAINEAELFSNADVNRNMTHALARKGR